LILARRVTPAGVSGLVIASPFVSDYQVGLLILYIQGLHNGSEQHGKEVMFDYKEQISVFVSFTHRIFILLQEIPRAIVVLNMPIR
jgi:hypothetical protein